jgi:four helix bundle protein
MEINSFRDLRVWKAGMDLVEQTYRLTSVFPRSELYGLAAQLQRAAVSIPSNIAEGHARAYSKEYLHHLSMALASLAELETQLEIATRLKYLSAEQLNRFSGQSSSLGKQLRALRAALQKGKRGDQGRNPTSP